MAEDAMETMQNSLQPPVTKLRLLRCVDWLQKQNSDEPKKLSLQNQNDIQFIIQTNADRKRFFVSVADDKATVPAGIDEPIVEPKAVSARKLRTKDLHMECEWQGCGWVFSDYELLQRHVRDHTKDLHVINDNDLAPPDYVCLWDVCGHKTADFNEMVRHINYHAYHTRLLAIGFNGRATLKLARCKKDSSKRNQLPLLRSDHCCMWTGCDSKFNSIQTFFDHVKMHVAYSDTNLCSWAGCGAMFPRNVLLGLHVKTHTCERVIACYHCGKHFSCNVKLGEHLKRQNVYSTTYSCNVCGVCCATAYLLREHSRQHINAYACALCDMSSPSPAALAQHVRYRHFAAADKDARPHKCPHCKYRAVTRSDLNKHIPTHARKKKRMKKEPNQSDSVQSSNEENTDEEEEQTKKEKVVRKYACHMCPEKIMKVFQRGSRLTKHLRKVHGAQWPCGHSRFRYQISDDGMYRLTTTRYEFLDVSKKIVDGYSWPKESLNNTFEFNLELKSEATDRTPKRFEITLKNGENNDENVGGASGSLKQEVNVLSDETSDETCVEITINDVDEDGNIINSEVINSDVLFK